MSSKSRKHSSPPNKKRSAAKRDAGPAVDQPASEPVADEPASVLDSAIPDDLIHAPKETSRLKFVLMILLVIFLLIIFMMDQNSLQNIGRRATADDVVATWVRPGHGEEEILASELQAFHRAAADTARVDPFLGIAQGQSLSRQPTQEDAIRLMLLDKVAFDSGIRVTDADLAKHLELLRDFMYGDAEALRAALQQYMTPVEDTIRRALRVQRFEMLAGYAGAVASPDAIEEQWHDEHAEVSLEYVSVSADGFVDAARAEIPGDEELEAWFDEKPDWERSALNLPEKRAAEVAIFKNIDATPAAGLLAAFPPAEGTDPDERANEYYNAVFTRRFVRPVPDEVEPEEVVPSGAFLSFDEVKDQALAEAPVYDALQAWLTDLTNRQAAGEEVDLLAEATQYGLGFVEVEPMTREELMEHPELGDVPTVESVFVTQPDSFAYTVASTADGLAVVRVTERVEASLPPFAEIRAEVAEMWVEPRGRELATEALEALWDMLPEFEPEEDEASALGLAPKTVHRKATAEAFRAAVAVAGLDVNVVDWFDRGASPKGGDPVQDFLSRNQQLTTMESDEVGEPLPGPDRDTIYLVRKVGERELPVTAMSPRDYQRYKNAARGRARASLREGIDLDYLSEQFGLVLNWSTEPEEEDVVEDEAAEEAGAEG